MHSGSDLVTRIDTPVLSSAAIVGIAIAIVFLLLLLVDFLCCMLINAGIMAALCRRKKRSPSELDDESKIGRWVLFEKNSYFESQNSKIPAIVCTNLVILYMIRMLNFRSYYFVWTSDYLAKNRYQLFYVNNFFYLWPSPTWPLFSVPVSLVISPYPYRTKHIPNTRTTWTKHHNYRFYFIFQHYSTTIQIHTFTPIIDQPPSINYIRMFVCYVCMCMHPLHFTPPPFIFKNNPNPSNFPAPPKNHV